MWIQSFSKSSWHYSVTSHGAPREIGLMIRLEREYQAVLTGPGGELRIVKFARADDASANAFEDDAGALKRATFELQALGWAL